MASPRSLRSTSLLFSSSCALLVAIVAACSADGTGDPLAESSSTPAEPAPTALLPPPSSGDRDPVDAGDASADAKSDAKTDSGADAGKPAPSPGASCPKNDEIFTRACGACGKQQALCLAGKVSEYSMCEGELAGGCVPGTTQDEPCGNCGTRKKTCNAYCAWTTGACTGEPPSSCIPTANDFTSAGCTTAGYVRTRTCGSSCTWSGFSSTCDPLRYQLTVGATSGETVSAIYPLRAAKTDKRMTGTCPNGTLSATTTYPYVYVELVNPTGQTLTLSAWNTTASATSTVIDTTMAWYASGDPTAFPGDDAARKACAKGVVDSCPAGLPCGDYRWGGLTGTNAITVAPAGSVTLFFGSYYPAGGSTASEGDVKLVVRTDSAL
ncbi:MAG: hypothetical protein JST00_05865 [Deltaproteobacteria bacterium]|nr:hypothetical protein [Deltaproteobacteria bacterium]